MLSRLIASAILAVPFWGLFMFFMDSWSSFCCKPAICLNTSLQSNTRRILAARSVPCEVPLSISYLPQNHNIL